MCAIDVERYTPQRQGEWDMFVARSCNATFLHRRGFMDYHADRFTDHSLLFRDADGRLQAVMPASLAGGVLTSHGGLTYGGLLVSPQTTALSQLAAIDALVDHCRDMGFSRIVVKPIPYIYASQPSEAIRYAFFRHGFKPTACGLSMAIDTRSRLPMRTLRLRGARKALRLGLRIEEGYEHLQAFHGLLTDVLQARHGVRPVHTLEEMQLLSGRFTNETTLHTVFSGDELVGGVWMFHTGMVAHAQYIAASDDGTRMGALDMLFCHLIDNAAEPYFDFGICTERGGEYLNQGLLFQKEGFGARPVTYEEWSLDINIHIDNMD